ncbi:MAG TPA: GGDEF domain-containing protein [Chloroflexia bacterium]|nr:GGDEF domain-containing protein [Chloroflexia bacterium]
MLRRVSTILNEQIEEITRGWVADLRRTPQTAIHNELFSAQIVDGMKAMLAHLASAIGAGVAPDAESALAAAAAELSTQRAVTPFDTTVEPVPPGTEDSAGEAPADFVGGRQPEPSRRWLYRARRDTQGPVDQVGPSSEALRQALALAIQKGQLRQSQGYQINEVVQEYIHIRRRIWRTLGLHMRQTDRPAMHLAIYLDGLLDDLLTATVQAYQDAAVGDLERRVLRDPLTGLYHHDYCWERIHEEVRRARRTGCPLTLIMLDVDHLKQINDTYGHQMGDRVILHAAKGMREVARESDILCRYAGDEFIIILPDSDKAAAMVLADRLHGVLRGSVAVTSGFTLARPKDTPPPIEIFVTVSAGLATYPDDAQMAETLMAQADAALYRAKAAGRDRIAQ